MNLQFCLIIVFSRITSFPSMYSIFLIFPTRSSCVQFPGVPKFHYEPSIKASTRIKNQSKLAYHLLNMFFLIFRNPGFKTIEEDLMKAFRDAEIISDEWYENPQKCFFQRASRTDKGVSAARMVMSLKLCKLNLKTNHLEIFSAIFFPFFNPKNNFVKLMSRVQLQLCII